MLKIKFNKQFFLPSLILFFVISIGFFVFSPVSFKNVAMALQGDYGKPLIGGSLIVSDWNLLDDDFLDKEDPLGDTMAGPLTLPATPPVNTNHATTKNYVDTEIAASSAGVVSDITNTSGTELKMVCDEIIIDTFNTTQLGAVSNSNILVNIDVSSASLGANPNFVITLDGQENYTAIGTNNTYYISDTLYVVLTYLGNQLDKRVPFITADLIFDGGYMTPHKANQLNWKLRWCGISI